MSKFVKPESSQPLRSDATGGVALAKENGAAAPSDANMHNGYRLPGMNALMNAVKLSIVEDKPILMDYWTHSIDKTVLIGVKEDQEKLLVKSEEEYTSPIDRIYNVEKEYIIITENSIYLVDSSISKKRISS
jgi:hypothetical protein